MHDVEMRAGDFGKIKSCLDREGLGVSGMRELPIRQCAFLLLLELLARLIDQRARLAVNAGDRIGAEGRHRAEAVQQHVIGDRFHDPEHARHVELERTDAELLRIARDLADLLLGEDLRMEDGIDVAQLVHRPAERRQVQHVRLFQAAQEDADGGDAADHGSAGLGLGLLVVGTLVADVGVRIEDAGQHHFALCIIDLASRAREVLAQRDDLVAGDAHVRSDATYARDDKGPAADDQVILGCA